jgi:hypothetical protein
VSGQGSDRTPELRIADADRERAVQRLNDAVSEGRLSMSEFDERVAGVLRSRTAPELEPYLADLPGSVGYRAAPEHQELRTTMSTLKRTGRWVVPRRLTVHSRAGRVKLDLTDAIISHPVIEVTLQVAAATVTLVLPSGASVDVDRVEPIAGRTRVRRKVTAGSEPVGQPHLVVSGKLWANTLVVRCQRRFLGWRW